jgi:hypothetical protein
MKSLLTVLALCLLTISTIAQTQPVKKNNTILVHTRLPAEDAYKAWGKLLAQHGYALTETNKEFLTITTGPKDTSKWNYDFVLHSSIEDNGDIVIRIKRRQKSSVIANTQASEFFDWYYQGSADIFFKDITPLISAIPNSTVSYQTR